VEQAGAVWWALDIRLMAVEDVATAVVLVDQATAADSAEAMAGTGSATAGRESHLVFTARHIITGPPTIGRSAIPLGVLATIPLILTYTAGLESRSALEWGGAWWSVRVGAASDLGKPGSIAA